MKEKKGKKKATRQEISILYLFFFYAGVERGWLKIFSFYSTEFQLSTFVFCSLDILQDKKTKTTVLLGLFWWLILFFSFFSAFTNTLGLKNIVIHDFFFWVKLLKFELRPSKGYLENSKKLKSRKRKKKHVILYYSKNIPNSWRLMMRITLFGHTNCHL